MGEEIIIVPMVVLGLPWIIFHYITKWKTAATLTNDDETLLEELYTLARRLDERMDTVERLVAADNPDFTPARLLPDRAADNQPLSELDRLLAKTERKAK
ncbi:envelope stress response membrane protein PspB [Parablastomonas sp. CN1-191]|uniref:envelope stress response membrane protein PspB n=1 Tax=Parablastomonas sp. CN1-191 TaxID=3400908 RepID=UPI003BF7CD4E